MNFKHIYLHVGQILGLVIVTLGDKSAFSSIMHFAICDGTLYGAFQAILKLSTSFSDIMTL